MVAIVTGASSGIGQAIYEHLQGFEGGVIGVSRRGPDVYLDLLPQGKYEPSIDKLLDCECALLVNCAGMMSFDEYTDVEAARNTVELNFWVPYRLMRLFEADLIRNRGSVINIASVSAHTAEPAFPLYAASKVALVSLTRSFAARWAAHGVRVNSISPGYVKSNLVPGGTPQDLIDTIPLGFEAEPEMLLPVVDMLINSPYITGADIVVDGGLLS